MVLCILVALPALLLPTLQQLELGSCATALTYPRDLLLPERPLPRRQVLAILFPRT